MDRAVFHKSVVIIGAGMAGLSAAEHLVRNGWKDVVVLEAQDRIGGRIHTVQFGSYPDSIVEFGANWIHGEALNNPIMILACECGLVDEWVALNRIDGFCYTTAGEAIEQNLTSRMWHLFQKWETETSSTQCTSSVDRKSDIDMAFFFQNRFRESLQDFPKENHHHLKCIFNCLMNYERFHQGTSLKTVPAFTNLGLDCDVPGRNIKVKAGMSKLVSGLVQTLKSDQIKLKQEVTRISPEGEKVLVRCFQGDLFIADHVIVTMPLGVLKQTHEKLFLPELPIQKQLAIKSLSVGKVNKIYLKWEKPFWKSGTGSIKLGWSDSEKEVQHPSEWYKKIFGFDEVFNNRHVLVAWISGDEAEYVEGLSEAEIINVCTKLIRIFLGNPSIPKAINAVCSAWCRNEYTRGSYSNINHKTTMSTFQDLASPVCDVSGVPRILFAGEATVNNGYSTMNGARRSGLREAQNLLSLHSNKNVHSKL